MTALSSLFPDHKWRSDSEKDLSVSGLALDNRNIKLGMAFIALQGTQQHGLCFAEMAVAAGAVAVLYDPADIDKEPELNVPVIAVQQLAQQLGFAASHFYDDPSQSLAVVGVTGTDGKTSVTHFIAEALNALPKQRAAVVGTIGIGLPGQLSTATHTTPDAIAVQENLRALVEADFNAVAMEVSSHALDQQRVNGVDFNVAVLTNLTRDHLDYHGTVAAYAAAKRKLFDWPNLQTVVLNLDDAFGRKWMDELSGNDCQIIGYGVGARENYPVDSIVAVKARFSHDGIYAAIESSWGIGELHVNLLGRFNLNNALAALAVLLARGVAFEDALTALQEVRTVPGRMERVQTTGSKCDVLVIVDYAHTPGALESVLQAARVHTRKRVICVFGCGGDRDAGKRPLMAQAAEKCADVVIVTDDNPRTEAATRIFDNIIDGFTHPEKIQFEHNRGQAIRTAIQLAQPGDTVLIAGKGHETVQIINQDHWPFDDREQAASALRECAA